MGSCHWTGSWCKGKKTITDHPHLFKVDCHINVDRFRELLQHHLNQPFVQSVCHGLTQESAFTRTHGISQIDRLNQKNTWISSVYKLRLKFSLAIIQRHLALTCC
jgi:hypothetical protein